MPEHERRRAARPATSAAPPAGRQVVCGDRRDRREAPLLVRAVGKPDRREPLDRGPADRLQPAPAPPRSPRRPGARDPAERLAHAAGPRRRRARLDPVVALRLELERQLLAARLHDPPVGEHVHEVGHDVVEQPLVVRDHDERRGRGSRSVFTPAATIRSASMSSPESVSSRIASFGSSTAICRISLRFFSPPENPC